jgi:prepilin-type N-terminal cleavage/methylation domain-containing protein
MMQNTKFKIIRSSNNGFTLIEVLISAVLLVAVGAALVGLQYAFKENQVAVWQGFENVDEANKVMATIEKELRNCHESDNGSYPLVTASSSAIVFYSDYNFDGKNEKIRYTQSGTKLIKGIIAPVGVPATYPAASEKTMVISENIRNGTSPIFYYYNEDWPTDTTNNPLAPALRIADTRIVRVMLKVNIKVDPNSDYLLDSVILLRTLHES